MKRIIFALFIIAMTITGCVKKEDNLSQMTVDIKVSPESPVTETETTFSVDIKGGSFPYIYEWNFGDGLTGTKYTETITYTDPGEKTVTLKVTDQNGLTAQAEKKITVADKQSVPQLSKPAVTIKNISYNFVTVGWDPIADSYSDGTFGFEFTDASGNILNAVTSGKFSSPYNTVLSLGNLSPETQYKVRIKAVSTDESGKLSSEWTETEFTTLAKPAANPDAILEERFDGLIWCTDYFFGGYGFRPNDNAQKAATSLNVTADEFKNAGTTTGDYFATFTQEFRTATGIFAEWKCSKLYGCLGFGKMGTTSAAGYLTTPKLSKIDGVKDITISFKASPYYDWSSGSTDAAPIKIEALNAGVVENPDIDLSALEPLKWHEQSVKIKNATAETQVKISAVNADKGRFFIDDIVITAAAGQTPSIIVTPVSGEFTAEGGNITFNLASNSPWEASNVPEWTAISQSSGEAGSFEITFTAGKATEDRAATVIFKTTTGANDASAEITLEQKFQKPSLSAPVLSILKKTHNAAIIAWEDVTGDYTDRTYEFQCIDPEGNIVNAVTKNTFTDTWYNNNIAYGNLKPSSVYKCRMRAISTDETLCNSSEWSEIEVTTDAVPAEPQDCILSESFHNFVWPGDYLLGGYGFCPSSTKTAESLDLKADKFYGPGNSTGDYFNSGSFPASFIQDVVGLKGWSGSKVYGHIGYPKMGTGSAAGWIQTCKLEKVEGTQNLEVSFLICPYFDWKTGGQDSGSVTVSAEGAGEITSGAAIDLGTMKIKEWTKMTVTVTGATADTQIKFAAGGGSQRFFLDDLVIKVK